MTYTISEEFTWKPLKQGVVILNLSEGTYYTLNEEASVIWKGLMDNLSMENIVENLLTEFDCTHDQAAADVQEYIDSCLDEGVLLKQE